MRIGILGAGKMAEALGAHWVRAGHEVIIGSRTAERTKALADRIGAARCGTPAEAAEFGEVVLTALSKEVVLDVVTGLRDTLAGRVVVDCTAPFVMGTFVPYTAEPMVVRIAAAVPGARVVKAFNICAAEVYAMRPPVFDESVLTVPVCGDDAEAVKTVSTLVEDIGAVPVASGGLGRAALSEAVAIFAIGLWFTGGDPATVIPPLKHAFGS